MGGIAIHNNAVHVKNKGRLEIQSLQFLIDDCYLLTPDRVQGYVEIFKRQMDIKQRDRCLPDYKALRMGFFAGGKFEQI